MESETIFNEEVEPPGCLTGPVGLEHFAHSDHPIPSYPTLPCRRERRISPFKDGPKSKSFRKRFYPHITLEQWQDWRWQLRNCIRDADTLEQMIWLSEEERMAIDHQRGMLPFTITPYYASLLDTIDVSNPLRRAVVPVFNECIRTEGEAEDPLAEDQDSPVPGIVHRYPDRVLFLVTDLCSTYCRYCTRSRLVGRSAINASSTAHWDEAIRYIAANPAIRDVLLSGGDPLILSDKKIEWLLSRLRRIPHVELLRIGTKIPVTLPQRVTPDLLSILRRYHPLWVSIHVTHPDELAPEMRQACIRLADAGIPLGSQTVLLAGINDELETMKRLFHGLLQIRVRPYYLYQCDPIPGSHHFRTPVSKGLEIIEGLRGHTTGYAVPTYVIDAPGGGGKIPLLPEYAVGQDGEEILLRNYRGHIYRYPDGRLTSRDIH